MKFISLQNLTLISFFLRKLTRNSAFFDISTYESDLFYISFVVNRVTFNY